MTRSQRTLARLAFAAYLLVVAFLCFADFSHGPKVASHLWGIATDKIVHFVMFFPFPILAWLSFDRYTETVRASLLLCLLTLGLGLLVAALTEFGQAVLTTWRSGDLLDFAADALALTVSTAIAFCLDVSKQKQQP